MYSPAYTLASYDGGLQDKIGSIILYVIRHAEVKSDTKGKIRGLSNQDLDEEGEKQAKQLADFFEDRPLSAIYADDLKRSSHTAEIIAAANDLTVTIDIRLRSWDVGTELEGKPIEENEDVIAELRHNPEKIPVGGQSWGDYQDQVMDWFRQYASQGMDGDPVAAVTHGSAIQIIWSALGEDVEEHKYDAIPIEPSGVAGIYLTRLGYKAKILRGEEENLDE